MCAGRASFLDLSFFICAPWIAIGTPKLGVSIPVHAAMMPNLFLVQALDSKPTNIPEGAQIVEADNIETLVQAQQVKQMLVQFIRHRQSSISELRRTIQQLIAIQ